MKKPVLIRLDPALHEKLLVLSADLTVQRKRSVTVPALIVELVTVAMVGAVEPANAPAMPLTE